MRWLILDWFCGMGLGVDLVEWAVCVECVLGGFLGLWGGSLRWVGVWGMWAGAGVVKGGKLWGI
jgi:hypothetical protein